MSAGFQREMREAMQEPMRAAEQAKADLQASIKRRLAAATDQIASAEANAVREVRDRAIAIATQVAAQVIAEKTSAADANKLIDASISEVGERLH